MRVVTYLRVSTGDQVRSGLGLEAQRAALVVAGERDGWEFVAECVDEGISGRVRWCDRPALAAAVQLVDVGDADAVGIARLDRLARRTEDALELVRQLGTGLVCLNPSIDTTSATGWFGLTVLAAAAELESTLASERTRAAMLAKAARGERIGRPRSCSDEVLDQVLELRRGGATLQAIAAAMNAAGVVTPAGSPRWWPSHVSRLLRTQDARSRADEGGRDGAVGFANLYEGEIYGECLCGWSTTDPDPDLNRVHELVAEARSRVIRHR